MQVVNHTWTHWSSACRWSIIHGLTGVVRAGGRVADAGASVEDMNMTQQAVSSEGAEVEGSAGEGSGDGALAGTLLHPAHLHPVIRTALYYLARVFRIPV